VAEAGPVAVEPAPIVWQARIDALLASGDQAKAIELLGMWSRQCALTPWVMERLGTLQLAAGKRLAAGQAFFWAGRRDRSDVAEVIAEFLASVRRRPDRLVATLPRKARLSIDRLPESLQQELRHLGVTDAVVAKANRPESKWSTALLTLLLVTVLVLAVVGGWTCLRALRQWLGTLLG